MKIFYVFLFFISKKHFTFALAIGKQHNFPQQNGNHHYFRRDGRVVDYNGLENRRTERYRGFESLSLRFTQANESLSYNNLGTFSLSPFFLWSTFWPISWPTFWPAFYSEDANKTLRICFSCKYFCTNKMVFTNRRCESYKLFSNNK